MKTNPPVITAFACAHQVKKYAYRMKQTIFNRFHTLTPVSISNKLHAIALNQDRPPSLAPPSS